MDAPTRRRPAPLVVLLFAAALGLLAGMVWTVATPARYSATASVFVSAEDATAVSDLERQSGLVQQAGDSFAEVATAPIVLDPVARRLGVAVDGLADRVSAEREDDTAVLRVRVEDPSAARAASAANAVAQRLVAVAPSLTPASADRAPSVHLTQVERATAAAAAGRNGLVTVLLGLLAGVGVGAVLLLVGSLRRRPPGAGGLAAPSLL